MALIMQHDKSPSFYPLCATRPSRLTYFRLRNKRNAAKLRSGGGAAPGFGSTELVEGDEYQRRLENKANYYDNDKLFRDHGDEL